MTETLPTVVPDYIINNRIRDGWTLERARTTPPMGVGRPPVDKVRPKVTKRTRRVGEDKMYIVYDAYVCGQKCQRTYLRTYDTKAEAMEACRKYIETGEKPEKAWRNRNNPRRLMPYTPPEPKSAPLPRKKPQTTRQRAKREKPVPVTPAPEKRKQPIDRIAMMRKIMREKFAA